MKGGRGGWHAQANKQVLSRGTPRPAALHCQTDKRRGPHSRPGRVAGAGEGAPARKSGIGSANCPLEHVERAWARNPAARRALCALGHVAMRGNVPNPGLHCKLDNATPPSRLARPSQARPRPLDPLGRLIGAPVADHRLHGVGHRGGLMALPPCPLSCVTPGIHSHVHPLPSGWNQSSSLSPTSRYPD